jgi:hypothetical protein
MDTERIAELRELVAHVRQQRALTLGAAASASDGRISHETWRRFERGDGELTKRVREGIAKAFGWDLTWPENPPVAVEVTPRDDQLMALVAELVDEVRMMRGELRSLSAAQTPPHPAP